MSRIAASESPPSGLAARPHTVTNNRIAGKDINDLNCMGICVTHYLSLVQSRLNHVITRASIPWPCTYHTANERRLAPPEYYIHPQVGAGISSGTCLANPRKAVLAKLVVWRRRTERVLLVPNDPAWFMGS